MIVEVTQTDILLGLPKEATWCPIAHAINRRQGKRFSETVVSQSFILTDRWGRSKKYLVSPELAAYINKFDSGEEVEPILINLSWWYRTAKIESPKRRPGDPRKPLGLFRRKREK